MIRKRRFSTMNLKENSRVTLPRPVSAKHEAGIEMRRKSIKKVIGNFKRENCNKRNEQKPKLNREESTGLKSLQIRIKKKEIVVLRTDNSSKLAVTDIDTYIEMGKKNTRNDEIISMEEVKERLKIMNGHSAMLIKITGMGNI